VATLIGSAALIWGDNPGRNEAPPILAFVTVECSVIAILIGVSAYRRWMRTEWGLFSVMGTKPHCQFPFKGANNDALRPNFSPQTWLDCDAIHVYTIPRFIRMIPVARFSKSDNCIGF
jgi:hypothetical protein